MTSDNKDMLVPAVEYKHKFCFYLSLKTAATVIAFLTLIRNGFQLDICGLSLDVFDDHFMSWYFNPDGKKEVLLYNVLKVMYLVRYSLLAVGIIMAVLLIVGAYKNMPKLVLTWVVFENVNLGLYIVTYIVFSSVGWIELHQVSTLSLVLITVITLYCLVAMVKLYQELRSAAILHHDHLLGQWGQQAELFQIAKPQ